MALPPHIIKRRIDALPEGPEKEKRLASFRRNIKFVAIAYPIMFIGMSIMTLILIYLVATKG